MNENKLFNMSGYNGVPSISVNRAVSILAALYCNVINNNSGIRSIPSVMLWGPPGVGKSQAVRQIADKIAKNANKQVRITDVRLMLFNPIDLRGIPTANEEKTLAVWLRPKIFDMDRSPDVVNILFLDEISAAPQSVQAAAYQITLDRTVGEHKLPDNCIVIAAGNRVTDKSVTYRMPKALANRLLHLEIVTDNESWREWAAKNKINDKVIGFISFKPERLMCFDTSTDDIAFATPRSWEMVSKIMSAGGDNIEELFVLISGLVGVGVAEEFRTWTKVYDKLPSIEGIFEGTVEVIPKGVDALYALINAMTKYASDHRDDLDGIANSIAYAEKLPADFATVLMKEYIGIEENYKSKLLGIPEFASWLRTKGTLLNGIR